jgi:hypothetical protein
MQLEVGTLLKSVWGYDQTNVDYYVVTAKNGSTMNTIRAIEAEMFYDSSHCDMVGTCRPSNPPRLKPNEKPIRCKPNKDGYIRLTSYSYARPCQPDDVSRWSSYA